MNNEELEEIEVDIGMIEESLRDIQQKVVYFNIKLLGQYRIARDEIREEATKKYLVLSTTVDRFLDIDNNVVENMVRIFKQIEENIQGIRAYVQQLKTKEEEYTKAIQESSQQGLLRIEELEHEKKVLDSDLRLIKKQLIEAEKKNQELLFKEEGRVQAAITKEQENIKNSVLNELETSYLRNAYHQGLREQGLIKAIDSITKKLEKDYPSFSTLIHHKKEELQNRAAELTLTDPQGIISTIMLETRKRVEE